MTANNDNVEALLATSTPTGVLDHAAIESRARQLRSETLRALLKASARRVLCTLELMTRWPKNQSPGIRNRMHAVRECHC